MKLILILNLFLVYHPSLLKADEPLDWWQTGVFYQIYPRSFKDSDGDGVGDLNGITEKVDYLKQLGITAVWLSPIFKSPMADFGYDISDYRNIEPLFGTLDDFEKLKNTLHLHGMKLILDFVPNHSSDEHEWFQNSVKNITPYRDYYVWKDGRFIDGVRHPPNNWVSQFGGAAWTWNDQRQQYYLHQFHYKQPDLNYRNPLVVEEMKEILRFWLNKGVDGFRMDAVFTIFEDDRFLDEPRSFKPGYLPTDFDYYNHKYMLDQPETFDMIYQFREVLDSYSSQSSKSKKPCSENDVIECDDTMASQLLSAHTGTRFMATEAYSPISDVMKYYGNTTHNGAHFPFNFLFITDLNRQSDASDFEKVIKLWYSNMPTGKWANWVVGNHDQHRVASRYGRELVDGIHMIQFLLPGTVITYMGDELALENTFIRWDETIDPPGLNAGKDRYLKFSRDPERAPFLWDSSVSAGFSTNKDTWLPVHPGYWHFNFQKQLAESKSHFKIYRKLVGLTKHKVLMYGELAIIIPSDWVIMIVRTYEDSFFLTIVNLGSRFETLDLRKSIALPASKLMVYVSSMNSIYQDGDMVPFEEVHLRPKAGIVLTNTNIKA
nr:PREDICTED: maltase A3-like [Bemisia tabaci]XP_018917501.1 PREDICTED: maltase A3-like [Bemisia tabaci]